MERKNEPVKKKVLGRGLSALLTGTTPSAGAPGTGRDPGFLQIPVEKIRAGSLQPRRHLYPGALEELVASIREKGVLQPVLVRPTPDGYELVAGERRFSRRGGRGAFHHPGGGSQALRPGGARSRAGGKYPADGSERDRARRGVPAAGARLLPFPGAGGRAGREGPRDGGNTVRLLKLPPPVRQAVADGRPSLRRARPRAPLSAPPEHASAICETVLRRGLSVRETERLCGPGGNGRPRATPPRRMCTGKASRRNSPAAGVRGFGSRYVEEGTRRDLLLLVGGTRPSLRRPVQGPLI